MESTPEVTYDIISHIFMCNGHVDRDLFLEALWNQWDTDWCKPDTGVSYLRHSYARFIPGKVGYWAVCNPGPGAKPVTCIDGEVINMGPQKCYFCHKLMQRDYRSWFDDSEIAEAWTCKGCGSQLVMRRLGPVDESEG